MALDFVIVAVPHHAGRAAIEECAVRGVHVLKEKPFATSLPEARELASICQQAQVELMVTSAGESTRLRILSASGFRGTCGGLGASSGGLS
ncbi:Gfo/Idh/MocA family oxidoreductase [Kitasatospora sp. NPDC087271]|uniref:Gfo/Idh/MocA family oxidoreductase n=1 Tax=Kitasatospora sp. NPDC087271 TaxID=3364067 RepID=UPI003829233D